MRRANGAEQAQIPALLVTHEQLRDVVTAIRSQLEKAMTRVGECRHPYSESIELRDAPAERGVQLPTQPRGGFAVTLADPALHRRIREVLKPAEAVDDARLEIRVDDGLARR